MFHALRRPESAILQRHRALGFDCVKGEKKGGSESWGAIATSEGCSSRFTLRHATLGYVQFSYSVALKL
jgi:hypothetical protein